MASYKTDHRAPTRSIDLKKIPYIAIHYKTWIASTLLCDDM